MAWMLRSRLVDSLELRVMGEVNSTQLRWDLLVFSELQ